LREALHPNDILAALQAIGLECSDIAEGIDADERTVRRWLDGQPPNRKHEQTIGALRVLAIHMLQRGGLPVDMIARWLRLPDSELGFDTPLKAVAEGRLAKAVVAYDAYLAPRPGTSSEQLDDQPTGEFSAVG
jgi:hypothetical protein